jgi:aspartyl-tRNA(Asn)/glutamyl-tRNA(Gln) amidotransferase subunit A
MTQTKSDICAMSGAEQAALIRTRQASPVEVTEAVLDRIEKLEPLLHAFCTLTADIAMEDAKRAEDAVMRGGDLGPLHGVPISIKDLICTKGIRTMSGSKAYEDFVPDEDDIVVERVKAAGAVMLGKTNVAELGYGGVGWNLVAPVTSNPWDLSKTSGGSSAGSAAAVASGMGALTLGSDGGGSVRGPSSHNSLFGMKASFGRVPLYPGCRDERYPGVSSWETIEHIGPMTRTVEDSALLLSVVVGPDMRDRHSLPAADFDWMKVIREDFSGKKIAFSPDFGIDAVDDEVREITARAARIFADELGCEVVEDTPDFPDMKDAFWAIVMRDTDLVGMRALLDRGLLQIPHLVDGLKRQWTAEDFSEANKIRQATVNVLWRFMSKYDLLLSPVNSTPAFDHGLYGPAEINGKPVTRGALPPFASVFNWTGQPAASIPAGFTKTGLPVGLQIVGRHLDDAMVMRAAAAFERVAPWKHIWPPIVESLGASTTA